MASSVDVKKHKDQSEHYYRNALRFIERKDAEKSSELLWGAMAQAMKALAAVKHVPLKSHNDIRRFVKELVRETDDVSIWDVFREAESLHSNFYETGLLIDDVKTAADRIFKTISKLYSYIPEEN